MRAPPSLRRSRRAPGGTRGACRGVPHAGLDVLPLAHNGVETGRAGLVKSGDGRLEGSGAGFGAHDEHRTGLAIGNRVHRRPRLLQINGRIGGGHDHEVGGLDAFLEQPALRRRVHHSEAAMPGTGQPLERAQVRRHHIGACGPPAVFLGHVPPQARAGLRIRIEHRGPLLEAPRVCGGEIDGACGLGDASLGVCDGHDHGCFSYRYFGVGFVSVFRFFGIPVFRYSGFSVFR